MIEEISDNKLLYAFRRLVDSSPDANLRHMLRSTRYCGSKPISHMALQPSVFLVKNDKSARYAGVLTCKNSWYCPVCSARVMSKYASDIAAAIDALKSASKPQLAAMFTFTIPHTSGMTCEETTEILYATWKDFTTHGNKNQNSKYYAKEKRFSREGEKVLKVCKTKLADPFASFCEEFNCVYRVKVCEFTYGEHGWHPHFHCLFWCDACKFENVTAWEELLNMRWLQLAKRNTLKIWNSLYPSKREKNQIRLECMYDNLKEGSQGCFISKDKEDKIIIQKSSSYICGWGADKELTGNVQNKASQEGHLTPRQILEKYSEGDENMGKLYLEYCRATRAKKHRRINFSKGLRDVIAKYKLTNVYAEVLKKKATEEAQANGIWREVCWFKSQQWRDICLAEKTLQMPIRYLLLKMAMENNGCKLIEDFLLSKLNIDIRNNGRAYRVDIYADTFKFVAA